MKPSAAKKFLATAGGGPVSVNYFPPPQPPPPPQQQAVTMVPGFTYTTAIPTPQNPPLIMPARSSMFIKEPQPQQQVEEGELTPRGKNRRPVTSARWSCTPFVAWTALFLSFFALVMVAIVYFSAPSLTDLKRDVNLLKVAGQQRQPQIAPETRSGHVLEMLRHMGHNHTHYVKFQLSGVAGQFARWPEVGVIEGLDFKRLANMRVCCHLSDQYFVCDSGQGATNNIGLECIVRNEPERGTHLLVYVQSAQMNGAQCTFMWQTRDPEDVLPPLPSGKNEAIANELQKEKEI